MEKFRITIITAIIIGVNAIAAFAQLTEDALRFANTGISGSARIQAMAGSQYSIGADLSNITGNPAGLGFYRGGDASISPQISVNSAETNYFGGIQNRSRTEFDVNSFGVVFTKLNRTYAGKDVTNGFTSFTFGLGYTRNNNFDRNFTYGGKNDFSSMAELFAQNGNVSLSNNELGAIDSVAFLAYIMNYDTIPEEFVATTTGGNFQSESIRNRGYQSDFGLSFGTNISNAVYLGTSIGISSLSFRQNLEYSETNINDPANGLEKFDLDQALTLSGAGANIKVGLIVRPVDMLRFGLSAQSSTQYLINERSEFSLSSVSDSGGNFQQSQPFIGFFEYYLKTPARYTGSMAVFFGKRGFISADVEYLKYGNTSLSTDLNDFTEFIGEQNSDINSLFGDAINLRLGGEYRIGPVALRAGYANYGNPLSTSVDLSRNYYTGGFGIKFPSDMYLDFASVYTVSNGSYAPYALEDGTRPTVDYKYTDLANTVTIGFRF
jgi:hypothetical protein